MDRVRTCADSSPGAIHDESTFLPRWEENGAQQLSARCSRRKPQGPVCSPRAFRFGACSLRLLQARWQKARQTVRLARDPRLDFRGLMCSYLISFPSEKLAGTPCAAPDVDLTDRNLLRPRFLCLRHRHGQHSILIGRADFVRIHSDWQGNASTEFADITLCAFGLLA